MFVTKQDTNRRSSSANQAPRAGILQTILAESAGPTHRPNHRHIPRPARHNQRAGVHTGLGGADTARLPPGPAAARPADRQDDPNGRYILVCRSYFVRCGES